MHKAAAAFRSTDEAGLPGVVGNDRQRLGGDAVVARHGFASGDPNQRQTNAEREENRRSQNRPALLLERGPLGARPLPFSLPELPELPDKGVREVASVAEDDVGGHELLSAGHVLANPTIRGDKGVAGLGQCGQRRVGIVQAAVDTQGDELTVELLEKRRRALEPRFIQLPGRDISLLSCSDGAYRVVEALDALGEHGVGGGEGAETLLDAQEKERGSNVGGKQKRKNRQSNSALLHAVNRILELPA